MLKAHEIASKQREHSEALDKDTKKFQAFQDEMNENKEAGFNQFMELQMAIENINEQDAQRDIAFEKVSNQVVILETKGEAHDGLFEQNDENLIRVGETINSLQNMDETINADVIKLRNEELHETNNQLANLMESLDKKNEGANGRIDSVQAFASKIKDDLVEANGKLGKLPNTINMVKDDLLALTRDANEHQQKTDGASQLTDEILKRLGEVEGKADSIKFLKDKSVAFSNGLEQMKKDFETQIQALSKNEVLVTRIKDDSRQLERR